MKVLVFMTQFFQLSGAERLAVELAEDLNKKGVHADILSMYTDDLPGVAEAKKGLLKKGIPVVHFLGMKIHPSVVCLVPAILKLRKLLREEAYIIIETSMVLPSMIASLATWGTNTRQVAGLHQVFRRDRDNSMNYKFWRVILRCNQRIRYYAISDYVLERWLSYSGVSPRYVRRIYNAIHDDFFSSTPDSLGVCEELNIQKNNNTRLVIYVGRLAAYKGIDIVLDALCPLLEQEGVFLLFVGLPDLSVKGTSEMIQQMEQQVIQMDLKNRVKFLGYRKDISRLMASADVLVHPTHIEGFGLSLVEAMATGLPVVASDVEGIPEVLAGTDSLMVPPGDPKALRGAVLTTMNRSRKEAHMALEKGRVRSQCFRTSVRTDLMIKLFDDVLLGKF